MERTLVLIKPDGVQRNLIGNIITRLEQRGLILVAAKLVQVSNELASEHYKVHLGKSFYAGLIQYITKSPVMAMVWEGPEAIKAVRQTMGATNPLQAAPGTVRHDFGLMTGRNLTHASDSPDTAQAEIALWFKPEEIITWSHTSEDWLTGDN
ncbi:MAG TPA: nucleoside-diphosphate kinase [Anaerolineaceae bacterium]|nr:nucleoside-diphosphate kinase [Anaerolineaceae bacterium]HPD62548.1 nucleoside-diphosphate kinase [Anaerolineaceae bacterium]HQK05881.1 nucleoside-diphosphate kinase [Anaerolineaceae bacterium]HUM62207.1 nucleoside-diphosphate kinase [Anaerolineaceae bacterium]